MSLRLLSFFSVFTLLMNACTFSKKTPDEVKADAFDEVTKKLSQDEEAASITKNDISYEFVPLAEPNQYKLVVKLSKSVPFLGLVIRGVDTDAVPFSDTVEYVFSNAQGEVIDIAVKTFTSKKKMMASFTVASVPVPKDLVIDRDLYLSDNISPENLNKDIYEKISYSRVFIKNKATIYTYGSHLAIDTNEIISEEESTITTFPRSYSGYALFGNRSKAPASIVIKAKKMTGRFKIQLVGLSGYRGRDAQASQANESIWMLLSKRLNGQDGQDAKIRSVIVNQGRAVDGPSIDERFICERQPTNGEDGKDASLVHGSDGGPGGDVGDLVVDVEDYQHAKFLIVHQGGVGGPGGNPMPFDLPGGKGGKAGKSFKPCEAAQNGKDGRPALAIHSKPGADGPSGAKGQTIFPQSPYHFQYEW